MTLRTRTQAPRPPALRGVRPRYQVLDRRMNPPRSVGQLYDDPAVGAVVFEVFDEDFGAFLRAAPELAGMRYAQMLDVDPDPVIVHAESAPLALDDARTTCEAYARYRVFETSDPV